jgi:hypothetical protein
MASGMKRVIMESISVRRIEDCLARAGRPGFSSPVVAAGRVFVTDSQLTNRERTITCALL